MRKVPPFAKRTYSRLVNDERGSSIVELAIIFPIMLLLFAGVAEIGRLFYTYTTLAKATKMGARFLTTEKDAEAPDDSNGLITKTKTRAANLVVCGFEDCTGKKSILPGLTTANVLVTLPNTDPKFIGPRYVKVEIQDYEFKPLVYNVASVTNSTKATFYFSLEPATEMRYMH